ncbi:mechanosensitive ion channel family protein [Lutispora sp.]|uniref:mechanosensitive ion channel family protein n=1 Tax=Lutispora sp. TaxID=2828727 RepID=UPI002B1EEF4B|nr:mechanosensitive ion channel family protein [Lutispora sp.]MEA4962687.1 mechanosensitive ion channel family protein [Lutispora sp.]
MKQLKMKIISFLAEMGSFNVYLSAALKILFIIIFWRIINAVLNKVINNFFKLSPRLRMDEKKSNTLSGLMKSIIRYTIYIIMAISVLNVLNIPTQSILAAAGLGGLALGFGAQNLVKDVISGFFILFEDQYAVGDYVSIGPATGNVEDIGLRITKIRAFNGDLHIIPNGEIKTVINHSRGNSLAIIDISIAYEADADKAISILKDIGSSFYENNRDRVIEPPEVLGIISFGESDAKIRMIMKTASLKHWSVEREMRKIVKEAFRKENIEVPYPRRVYISRSDKA